MDDMCLQVLSCNEFLNYFDHYISRPKGYNGYILIYCENGSGFIEQFGKRNILNKGDLGICYANIAHIYGSNEITGWSILWVVIKDEISWIKKNMDLLDEQNVIKIINQEKFVSVFKDLISSFNNLNNKVKIIEANSYMRILLCECIKNLKEYNYPAFIQNAIIYMHENIASQISVESLIKNSGISKYHYIRLFKKYIGTTPMKYFNMIKINKISHILKTTNFSINRISDMFSYNNPYYFSKVFKDATGMAPTKFRNN